MMHSFMPGHTHSIRVVQRYEDPGVLFPELLVEATTGHPRLFGHRRDLIWGKDLRLFRGDSSKLFADGRIKLNLVRLKLWTVMEGRVFLIYCLPTNLLKQLPQGGTGVHVPPAFSLLRELDDRHRRRHLYPSLFPSATDAMPCNSLGLG